MENNEYIVEALIEIPMGTRNKYEIDKKRGKIKLNRVLFSQMTYPAEYGYIEDTLALDGDPLDILVLANTATFPGCYVNARVIGYLDMIDGGDQDEKIIAVMHNDPRFDDVETLEDIHPHTLVEIKHFFSNYKELQSHAHVEVKDYHTKEEAIALIEEYRKNYNENRWK